MPGMALGGGDARVAGAFGGSGDDGQGRRRHERCRGTALREGMQRRDPGPGGGSAPPVGLRGGLDGGGNASRTAPVKRVLRASTMVVDMRPQVSGKAFALEKNVYECIGENDHFTSTTFTRHWTIPRVLDKVEGRPRNAPVRAPSPPPGRRPCGLRALDKPRSLVYVARKRSGSAGPQPMSPPGDIALSTRTGSPDASRPRGDPPSGGPPGRPAASHRPFPAPSPPTS
jgi:hypothetical protein